MTGSPAAEDRARPGAMPPAGPDSRAHFDPAVIARLLSTDDLYPPTRAERNARMPRALRVTAAGLTLLAVVALGFVAYLGVVSGLHHHRMQLTAYADFRSDLALATAPRGQARPDDPTRPLAAGTPVALLEIPKVDLRSVVFEGTTAEVLEAGPGHLRSSPLPGQRGTSVLMGRSTMYGGPFGRIDQLAPGDAIAVTTGQGRHTYEVLGVRRAGDREPSLGPNTGILTLMTSGSNPFVPSEVLRVDAALTSPAQPRPRPLFGPDTLAAAELPMGIDTGAWLPASLFATGLVLVAGLAGWTRRVWGRPQTWLVAVPLLVTLSIATADQATRLLPNLI